MFLVKQGCPYRPHYYSDNSVFDQDLVDQYKDCVKTAASSEVSYLRNDQGLHKVPKIMNLTDYIRTHRNFRFYQ